MYISDKPEWAQKLVTVPDYINNRLRVFWVAFGENKVTRQYADIDPKFQIRNRALTFDDPKVVKWWKRKAKPLIVNGVEQ